MSTRNYEQLKCTELRALLKARGLSTAGRKSVLVEKLALFDASTPFDTFNVAPPEDPMDKPCLVSSQDVNTKPASPEASSFPPNWSPTLPKNSCSPTKRSEEEMCGNNVEKSPGSSCSSPRRNLWSTPKSDSKKPRISFGSVEIRKYKVSHGGSLSTPSKGAYPIGLSWEIADEVVQPLAESDKQVSETNASPRRYSEKQRKLLLEKVDARSFFEKQASFETEKEELRQLRRARTNIGCHCNSPNSCGTSKCFCFKEGLPCLDDTCKCTCATCINPARCNFDQKRIDNYRKLRILEGAYTEANENFKDSKHLIRNL